MSLKRGEGLHEIGVTESIVAVSIKHARSNKAKKIIKVNVALGEASGMLEHCIEFYWDLVTKDTEAEGSKVEFRKIALKAECGSCENTWNPSKMEMVCPKCGKSNGTIKEGAGISIDSIEVS